MGKSRFLVFVPNLALDALRFSSDEDTYGFALLPSLYAQYPELDGIYIRYVSLPGGSSLYRQGSTVIHETGHWLGLLHTFQVSISCVILVRRSLLIKNSRLLRTDVLGKEMESQTPPLRQNLPLAVPLGWIRVQEEASIRSVSYILWICFD